VHGVEPADARGVHDLQPAGEQRAGQADLRLAPAFPVARVAGLGDVLGELLDGQLDALGRGPLRVAVSA
jgi:hypothetical protein